MERKDQVSGAGSDDGEEKKKPQGAGSGLDGGNNKESSDEPAPDASRVERTPFTSLSQVDADLALARALQDQERAYLLLRMASDGSEFNSSGSTSERFEYEDHLEAAADQDEGQEEEVEVGEEGAGEDEEEKEEVELGEREAGNEGQIDGSLFDSDEAFARALQEKEDRDTTARLMALAGIHDFEADYDTDSDDSQEIMWQDVDPDNMSYEELIALGEAVGTESKGLSAKAIAALPGFTHGPSSQDSTSSREQCAVCRHEYEEGDAMLTLPCKHHYHSECVQQWLHINKVCPVCSAEVSPPETSTLKPRTE